MLKLLGDRLRLETEMGNLRYKISQKDREINSLKDLISRITPMLPGTGKLCNKCKGKGFITTHVCKVVTEVSCDHCKMTGVKLHYKYNWKTNKPERV